LVLQHICPQFSDRFKISPEWCKILQVLGSFSSVVRFFHIDDLDYVKTLCTGVPYDETQGHLSKTSHMFVNVILSYSDKSLPDWSWGLFLEIVAIIEKVFSASPPPQVDDPARTGHGWFVWTPLRELKYYPDFDTFSRANGFHPEDPGEKFCRKETINTGTFRKCNPGVVFCLCPHGIVYGFHLMKDPEGRKDIFYVIWRFWPKDKVDLLTLIFDFGCQQDEYFFNREPEFFARCRIFVDKFHGNTHKCSPLYHLGNYPQYQAPNTSVVEQFNPFHNSIG